MEILDDGSSPERPYTWAGPPPRDGVPVTAAFEAELDPIAPDRPAAGPAGAAGAAAPTAALGSAPAGDGRPDDGLPAGRPNPVSVLVAAETLGLTGVLVAACTTLSSLPNLGLFFISSDPGTLRTQLQHYFDAVSGGGGLALLLGVAALYRLRPATPAAARAAAGAATLLGALLLVIGGVGLVHAASLPGSPLIPH